jgi:hypothetical protein
MNFEQLALFSLSSSPQPPLQAPTYDPYWDTEIVAPEHTDDRWNPNDFGEVPFKSEADQLTIFYDDSHEPPEPDDFNSIEEYEQAWHHWEKSVREQTENQCLQVAPEHSYISSSEVVQIANYLLTTDVREQLQAPQNIQSANKPNQNQKCNQWVEDYWVRRGKKKHEYYRYCWMEGRKIRRLHIGPVKSNISIKKYQEVKRLISTGKLSHEVIDYLKQETKN